MRQRNMQQGGFTLVELLIVMLIFGIFIGAVYSLYISHLRTALSREEVIDVQQNVRIAMERLARDIRMAGFLVPTPVIVSPASEKALSNHSSIRIYTGSTESTFVAINTVARDDKFVVTPKSELDNFVKNVDTVSIFRPSTKTLIGGTFTVISSSSTSGNLSISPAATSGTVRIGDMVCKSPDRVQYIVDRTDAAQGCDKSPCLKRNSIVIAQGISNLRFDYFIDGANTDPKSDASALTDDEIRRITAIRVTVTGQTSKKTAYDDTIKTRELTSLIKLRNYK